VRELGHEQPKTTKELLNITATHASSEVAVGAIFLQSSGKVALGGVHGTSTTTTEKGTEGHQK
jgi:hypothetical protein